MWLGPIKLSVQETPCRLAHNWHLSILRWLWLVVTRDVPPKRRVVRRTLTRSGVAKALRDRKGVKGLE
jgi:hypothetical protein